MFVWVHDHKTLGKDKLLGEAEVDVCDQFTRILVCHLTSCGQIWRHIQQRGQTAAEVSVELGQGSGLLRARLEFDPDSNPLKRTETRSPSLEPAHSVSPSRFSLSRRKLVDTSED